ncbi:hypothetical protein SAMN05421800_103248 [Chryseobacterium balustinum]|uniref:Uncharacterized protein n=1 Tax=Chryseobacterium balustinum TaxID=246 RepID=A0ABY1L6T7_9FLAO|nr:hypothetical protein SAMN05421800_103248 [Chryseobacterium balustinum]
MQTFCSSIVNSKINSFKGKSLLNNWEAIFVIDLNKSIIYFAMGKWVEIAILFHELMVTIAIII